MIVRNRFNTLRNVKLFFLGATIWGVFMITFYITTYKYHKKTKRIEIETAPPIRQDMLEDHSGYGLNNTVINRFVIRSNEDQVVLNERKFYATDVVIAVQVNNRLLYLQYLIKSLSLSVGINRALIIFSHSFYSERINIEISKIKFCKVMQIFYPYSIQLYPETFPGYDDTKRNARLAQIKHHWWWKFNFLFNHIKMLTGYEDSVIFLEEDHYVAPDFLHVLQLMKKHADDRCSGCDFLFALGLQHKAFKFENDFDKVVVSNVLENLGLTLTRRIWKRIVGFADIFCTYDDYNWDWTLVYIFQYFILPKIKIMSPSAARVHHVGSCGVHTHRVNCDPSPIIAEYLSNQEQGILYPVALKTVPLKHKKFIKRCGGWTDTRDHALCMNETL